MKGILLGFIYFVFIITIGFFNSFNSTILRLDNEIFKFHMILNQGWAFFTKDPRDVQTFVYHNGKNLIVPLSSSVNFFGFKRDNSRKSFEIGQIVKGVKDDNWKKTVNNNYLGKYIKIKSPIKNKIIKGKIIIINYERIPWAWAKYDKKLNFIKMYLKIEIV